MESKICKACKLEKEVSYFYKSKNWYSSNCKDCDNARRKKHYYDNQLTTCEKRRKYREDNLETVKLTEKKTYEKNKVKKLAAAKLWTKKNEDKVKNHKRRYFQENKDMLYKSRNLYFINNPGIRTFWTAARKAAKLQATPSWANPEKIKEIYKEAKRISEETKILHHVDHIIPLRGKSVSGLHVEWNLQIIPAVDNLKKSNRMIINE